MTTGNFVPLLRFLFFFFFLFGLGAERSKTVISLRTILRDPEENEIRDRNHEASNGPLEERTRISHYTFSVVFFEW